MRQPRGGGSFRGRGGRDRGGRGGGGRFGGGNRGGGRFGGGGWRDEGPPSEVVEVATFVHACEGEAVTRLCQEKIPRFNAPIYLQNKTQIGNVDEIFGAIDESMFSIKMMEGIVATSYAEGDKFYIDPYKLLPLATFLPKPKGQSVVGGRGGRGGKGGPPGRGRGRESQGFRGRGRGTPRGRGGFNRGRGRGY